MADPSFVCRECGRSFTLKPEVLARYPGWEPAQCMQCKTGKKPAKGRSPKKSARRRKSSGTKEQNLTSSQVLERFQGGPHDGVFTDGACSGNPGPGGWGVVHVEDGEIVAERNGHEPRTTNNRMELAALIAAYEMLPRDAEVTIWSDSNLCVQTLNQWAAGWKRLGWKRKTGPIKNVELVKQSYGLALGHRKVKLRWIKAHAGSRWNEYADSLATAYMRQEK